MVQKSPRSAIPAPPTQGGPQGLNRFFRISARGSTITREVRGGLVTFFAMAYIIALNPIILGTSTDINGKLISGLMPNEVNIGITMGMVAAATAVVAGVMTILMGLIGRFPVALAAGLGINALVAYSIAPMMEWSQAMGLIVWEGIIITILVVTKFRQAVMKAVPAA
ncbi:MAG: NCS2 family permease, partial [Propionibacteriaceae bacterium]|nr:NCS2 family permease [Propionibacteriaceae bacterium]